MNLTAAAALLVVVGAIAPPAYSQGRGHQEKESRGRPDKAARQEEKRARSAQQHAERESQQRQHQQVQQQQRVEQRQRQDQARQQQQQREQMQRQSRSERNYVQTQRSREQARAWENKRGWMQRGGWQGSNSWHANRAQRWVVDHRTWSQRGGYGGYYIPQDRFRLSFGRQHYFRIRSVPVIYQGYPRFSYGGFSFLMVDPWPEYWQDNWYDTDDVYIDYYDDGYYLYNRSYPDVRLAITVVL